VLTHDTPRCERQQTFGYTHEELKIIIAPMAAHGKEPIGSMGTDTPLAVLSSGPGCCSTTSQQLFAQVTNPPLDAIREELVTSVGTASARGQPARTGARRRAARSCCPVPDHRQRRAGQDHPQRRRRPSGVQARRVDGLYPVAEGGEGCAGARRVSSGGVGEAIERGAKIIVLSDRTRQSMAPIPSLLLTAACTTT
jgi:glutamate synthase (NADPH) large chain